MKVNAKKHELKEERGESLILVLAGAGMVHSGGERSRVVADGP